MSETLESPIRRLGPADLVDAVKVNVVPPKVTFTPKVATPGDRTAANKRAADHIRGLADRVESDELDWELSYGGNKHPMFTVKLIPRAFLLKMERVP